MSNFKKMVEARMATTGESWSTAARYVREQRMKDPSEESDAKPFTARAEAHFEARGDLGLGLSGTATAQFDARANVNVAPLLPFFDDQSAVMLHQRQMYSRHPAFLGGSGGIPDESVFGAGVLRETPPPLPGVLLKAEVIVLGDKTKEGQLVELVALPWFEIMDLLRRDPMAAYKIGPRKWEEIIAGAWGLAGYKPKLTPRSADGGYDVDVEATLDGVGSVRIYDEVKAYAPENPVPAEVVRAAVGVLSIRPNVSKAIITTTSTFAPGIAKDEDIQRLIPNRLELRPKDILFPWLQEIAAKRSRK